jgi:glycosyltransferase involved in cell wall biosynthesis
MIATDAPGCREIVIDDQTGLLVGIEDLQALAGAIVKLATSPEQRARYGKAARELVVSTLSARIIGEQIVQL